MTWQNDAACAGTNPDLFSPVERHPGSTAEGWRRANTAYDRFCKDCPVAQECLDWALEQGEVGVWAGYLFTRPDASRARPHVTADVRRMVTQGYSDEEIANALAMPSRGAVFKYRQRWLPETIGASG